MHWRTYDRLQARHYAADDRSMAGLMLFMTAGFQTAGPPLGLPHNSPLRKDEPVK
jgi:hypothetical protein